MVIDARASQYDDDDNDRVGYDDDDDDDDDDYDDNDHDRAPQGVVNGDRCPCLPI